MIMNIDIIIEYSFYYIYINIYGRKRRKRDVFIAEITTMAIIISTITIMTNVFRKRSCIRILKNENLFFFFRLCHTSRSRRKNQLRSCLIHFRGHMEQPYRKNIDYCQYTYVFRTFIYKITI